jgi:hypothetical protein
VRLPQTNDVELNARVERRADVKEAHGHSHGPGVVEQK